MNPFENFNPLSHEYTRANAAALAVVSQLAYEDERQCQRKAFSWGFDLKFYDRDDTQCILLQGSEFDVLAFRGTEADVGDVKADADLRRVGGPLGGNVHRGFLSAFNAVWDLKEGPFAEIDKQWRSGDPKPLFITGHSLGAALATLAAASLCEFFYIPAGVYTFGCPRVGDWRFAKAMNARLGSRFWRVENNNDIVPRIPPWIFGFRHLGQRVYLSSWGDVVHNPSWIFLLKDRFRGRWKDLGKPGSDGLKDHFSSNYTKILGS